MTCNLGHRDHETRSSRQEGAGGDLGRGTAAVDHLTKQNNLMIQKLRIYDILVSMKNQFYSYETFIFKKKFIFIQNLVSMKKKKVFM